MKSALILGATSSLAITISILFVGYAALEDLRKREVRDIVWLSYGTFGFLSSGFLASQDKLGIMYFGQVALVAGVGLALYFLKLFGGADAKALVCLSLAIPGKPGVVMPQIQLPIFTFSVLANAVILASLLIPVMFAKNLCWKLSTGRRLFEGFERNSFLSKLGALAFGYKMEYSKVSASKYLFLMEGKDKQTDQRRLEISFRVGDFVNQGPEGAKYVWVTPGIPFLLFIFSGLITTLLLGDLTLSLLHRFA